MKNLSPLVTGLIALHLLFISACSNAAVEGVKAELNKEFRLSPGQTAVISNEGITINFAAVTADSRCPSGVTCIWAGEAVCQTTVTINNTTYPYDLKVSGGSPGQTGVLKYTLNYSLEPYPKAGQTIDKSSYVLVMTVTK